MITTPNLRACQYEVLADRLALWEAIDANGARSKRALLAQVLLKRHPELGDRVAREVVAETLDAWPCCIRGLEALADPTSNLLIAGLTDFAELPIVRLHPVARSEPRDLPVLSLSVSTDDPEIFRVNLREEYDALFKALLQQGRYGRRELLEWIDRLRRDGWVSSFLTNESPRGRGLLQYLASLFPDERLGRGSPP